MNSIFDCLPKESAKVLQNRKRMLTNPIAIIFQIMRRLVKVLQRSFVETIMEAMNIFASFASSLVLKVGF
jgi:hypothetical protein